MSKHLAVEWNSTPILKFSLKICGKRRQSAFDGDNKATSKEGTFSVTKEIQGV